MAVIKPIFTEAEIQKRIRSLGAEISTVYGELESPVVIGVMTVSYTHLTLPTILRV